MSRNSPSCPAKYSVKFTWVPSALNDDCQLKTSNITHVCKLKNTLNSRGLAKCVITRTTSIFVCDWFSASSHNGTTLCINNNDLIQVKDQLLRSVAVRITTLIESTPTALFSFISNIFGLDQPYLVHFPHFCVRFLGEWFRKPRSTFFLNPGKGPT